MVQIHSQPIFESNFQYFLEGKESLLVIDPGDLTAVLELSQATGKAITHVLITHEHHDHIAALEDCLQLYPRPLLFGFDLTIKEKFQNLTQDPEILWEGEKITSFLKPGHTKNLGIFYLNSQKALFTGDLIFQMGCGRLMGGTMEEHFNSLQSLRSFPTETRIYCSHDYSEVNWRFVQKHCNPQYQPQLHQIPLILKTELEQNPFLIPDFETFKKLRELRNQFF